MNTEIDPENGFVLCDKSDPERTHFWCPTEEQWIGQTIKGPQWCEENTGRKCATHWRKPDNLCRAIESPVCVGCGGENGWHYFRVCKPVEKDAPFIAYRANGMANLFNEYPGREAEIWHSSWLAWRSIGPLPKVPVDEGEKLADEYVRSMAFAHDRTRAANDFLAGYAAGLKKGKL